jgi:hypothetical protein
VTTYNVCLEQAQSEVYRSLVWLEEEWAYVTVKFGDVSDRANDHLEPDEWIDWWTRQVTQYLDRARLFGVDTLKGRQALAKAMATSVAACSAAVRCYGDLPRGGSPSGQVIER